MRGNTNIWLNGIMGVVVGDALGCPVQFKSREEVARHPVTGMRGYGTFNLPEGSWTDDSSLTSGSMMESLHLMDGPMISAAVPCRRSTGIRETG